MTSTAPRPMMRARSNLPAGRRHDPNRDPRRWPLPDARPTPRHLHRSDRHDHLHFVARPDGWRHRHDGVVSSSPGHDVAASPRADARRPRRAAGGAARPSSARSTSMSPAVIVLAARRAARRARGASATRRRVATDASPRAARPPARMKRIGRPSREPGSGTPRARDAGRRWIESRRLAITTACTSPTRSTTARSMRLPRPSLGRRRQRWPAAPTRARPKVQCHHRSPRPGC